MTLRRSDSDAGRARFQVGRHGTRHKLRPWFRADAIR